jgi:iron(III) transport system substrate-binding protein
MTFARVLLLLAAMAILPLAIACSGGDDDDDGSPQATPTVGGSITVYSGRGEALVQPIIDDFKKATGIDVKVKYGDTAELAALIFEEGSRSPADVYFGQDAGALGALSAGGFFEQLPTTTLDRVPAQFRALDGTWTGISGRARVIVYNPDLVQERDLPASVKDLTDPRWKGRVGWAPTNGSFQAFVTALRRLEGDAGAKAWLEAMKANGVKEYKDNRAIVSAVASGEIAAGLVNHYYLWGFIKDQGEGFKARNHYTAPGDAGSLVNVAGAGVLKTSSNKAAAHAFIQYLLTNHAQQYFATQTFEYPLVEGIPTDSRIRPLAEIKPPELDLGSLQDLQGTLALLRSAGVLP